MDEFDDLSTYNGDTEHDMWVDFTDHEYTGELGEYFEDINVDSFVARKVQNLLSE